MRERFALSKAGLSPRTHLEADGHSLPLPPSLDLLCRSREAVTARSAEQQVEPAMELRQREAEEAAAHQATLPVRKGMTQAQREAVALGAELAVAGEDRWQQYQVDEHADPPHARALALLEAYGQPIGRVSWQLSKGTFLVPADHGSAPMSHTLARATRTANWGQAGPVATKVHRPFTLGLTVAGRHAKHIAPEVGDTLPELLHKRKLQQVVAKVEASQAAWLAADAADYAASCTPPDTPRSPLLPPVSPGPQTSELLHLMAVRSFSDDPNSPWERTTPWQGGLSSAELPRTSKMAALATAQSVDSSLADAMVRETLAPSAWSHRAPTPLEWSKWIQQSPRGEAPNAQANSAAAAKVHLFTARPAPAANLFTARPAKTAPAATSAPAAAAAPVQAPPATQVPGAADMQEASGSNGDNGVEGGGGGSVARERSRLSLLQGSHADFLRDLEHLRSVHQTIGEESSSSGGGGSFMQSVAGLMAGGESGAATDGAAHAPFPALPVGSKMALSFAAPPVARKARESVTMYDGLYRRTSTCWRYNQLMKHGRNSIIQEAPQPVQIFVAVNGSLRTSNTLAVEKAMAAIYVPRAVAAAAAVQAAMASSAATMHHSLGRPKTLPESSASQESLALRQMGFELGHAGGKPKTRRGLVPTPKVATILEKNAATQQAVRLYANQHPAANTFLLQFTHPEQREV